LLKEIGIIKTKIEKRIERDLQSDDIRLFIIREVPVCLLMPFFYVCKLIGQRVQVI
jgi:hypothetical protein